MVDDTESKGAKMKIGQGIGKIVAKPALLLFCIGGFLLMGNTAQAGSFENQNAIKAAQRYLESMPFSHDGLIKQLEFEEFSHEAAVYAADHCGADWTRQAALAAKNYLDSMPFSRNSLIEQLVFDGYTRSQAESGARAAGY